MKRTLIFISIILSILILCSCESSNSDQQADDIYIEDNSLGDSNLETNNLENSNFEASSFVSDYREGHANTRGNSVTNLTNAGHMARQDNWIYYSFGSGLCKIPINGDENSIVKLFDKNVEQINVVGDWIYCTDYNQNSLDGWDIWKIKTDGSEQILLTNDAKRGSLITVIDNYLYYNSISNLDASTKIYDLVKLNLENNEKQQLRGNDSLYLDVIGYDGRVYYTEGDRYFVTNTDFIESTELNWTIDGKKVDSLNIDNDGTRYTGYQYYRLTLHQSPYFCKIDEPFMFYEESINARGYSLDNGKIIFTTYKEGKPDSRGLFSINKDGTEYQKINNDYPRYILIVDDGYIYYHADKQGNTWCRCLMDGSQWEKLDWMIR